MRANPKMVNPRKGSQCQNKPIRTEYLIVDKGKLAGAGAHSYTKGDATKGSEEAAKFKART